MTNIENFKSIVKRKGYQWMPFSYGMCESLASRFQEFINQQHIQMDVAVKEVNIPSIRPKAIPECEFQKYYKDYHFKPGTIIDEYGVAHEPGSEAAFHMTKMYHPMESFDSVEQILAYPFMDYTGSDDTEQKQAVLQAHAADLVAFGNMQCTIWEHSWYLRGMENLMMDMMSEDDMATVLLDKITDNAVITASAYASSGVDVLFLGDDIGMQKTIMMSLELYRHWLKPRLKRVIDAAKKIKPDILVFYHSCGYIEPFIPDLIEVGVDVLNPVQPECMDFGKLHEMYGDRLSFHGTIGTQTTMPFGTPDDVKKEVYKNLDIAGEKGGLLVSPTHLLEPEVPVENVLAYIKACQEYTK